MYYFLYTSSDYNEPEISQDQSENVCLICWLPDNYYNTPLKNMKEFSFIIATCECNALFHYKCLNEWISNSKSCPICRKSFSTIDNFTNLKKWFFFYFFFNYTSSILQFVNSISIINLCIFYIYTIYIFYHFGISFYEENYI